MPVFYGYRLVAIGFVAQFVSMGVLSYVSGAFFLPMVTELGWSHTDFTLSRSIAQIAMGITGFFAGTLVDRHGARPLMLLGTTVLCVGLAAHSLIQSLTAWWLLNGVVATIGCALIGNLVVNVTLSKWFVEKRGFAVSWAAMGVSLAGIVLTPAVTYAIDAVGWREAWLLLALGAAVVMYPCALSMRREPEAYGLLPDGRDANDVAAGRTDRAARDLARSVTRSQALRTPTFYLLVLAFGLFVINIVVLLLHTIPYLTHAGHSRNASAAAIVVASIPAMLAKPIWGYFIDRLRPKPLAAFSAALTGIALAAIVFSVDAGRLPWIYAGYVVLGIAWGGMLPLQEVIWASYFGRRYLGAVRSAGLPFALLFGALAPWLVAYYFDVYGSYAGALYAVAGLNVLSGVMLAWLPSPDAPALGGQSDAEKAETEGSLT